MSACEDCWSEAYWRSKIRGGHQAEHYRDLLAENEAKHALLHGPAA
jgi:hypothetical protein